MRRLRRADQDSESEVPMDHLGSGPESRDGHLSVRGTRAAAAVGENPKASDRRCGAVSMALTLAAVLCALAAPAGAQSCRVAFAPGQEEPALRDVQTQLRGHGFHPGPIDGKLGPKTCAAVRAYQRAAGLPIDGVISPELQNHMRFIAPRPG